MSGWTFGFQVVNFLALAGILYRFLFKPVNAMIERRQGEIESATKAAASGKQAVEEGRVHYEHELEALKAEREKTLGELRSGAAKEQTAALQQAHAEGATLIEGARAQIAKERSAAVARLGDDAVALATDLSKRLLEQVAGGGVAEALLQQLCDHLDKLPSDRLRTLREELAGAGAGEAVEIATAPALSPEAEARFAPRIVKGLDASSPVRFVADAGLIAGAELRLPHTKISFCWRDSLTAAREELLSAEPR